MTDQAELELLLRSEWGVPSVTALPEAGRFLVSIPNPGQIHDETVVVVTVTDDGWSVSDAGHAAFWLGNDFDNIADMWLRSGTSVERLQNDELVVTTGRDVHVSARAVLGAASEFRQITEARHLIEAIREKKDAAAKAESSSRVMARELQALFEREHPSYARLGRLGHSIGRGAIKTSAPWSMQTPRGDRTMVVSTFIDLLQTPQVVRSALATTSLVLDVAKHAEIGSRLVVVRGGDGVLADLVDMYASSAIVVDSANHRTALETISEPLLKLVAA
jgi:hypothetical protein